MLAAPWWWGSYIMMLMNRWPYQHIHHCKLQEGHEHKQHGHSQPHINGLDIGHLRCGDARHKALGDNCEYCGDPQCHSTRYGFWGNPERHPGYHYYKSCGDVGRYQVEAIVPLHGEDEPETWKPPCGTWNTLMFDSVHTFDIGNGNFCSRKSWWGIV